MMQARSGYREVTHRRSASFDHIDLLLICQPIVKSSIPYRDKKEIKITPESPQTPHRPRFRNTGWATGGPWNFFFFFERDRGNFKGLVCFTCFKIFFSFSKQIYI
jgi:hypothetical protein